MVRAFRKNKRRKKQNGIWFFNAVLLAWNFPRFDRTFFFRCSYFFVFQLCCFYEDFFCTRVWRFRILFSLEIIANQMRHVLFTLNKMISIDDDGIEKANWINNLFLRIWIKLHKYVYVSHVCKLIKVIQSDKKTVFWQI